MSHPGPMHPPTGNPKFNVLMYYALLALGVTFSLAIVTPGYWRLLAIPTGALAVLLMVGAIRAGVAAEKRDVDQH